MTDALEARLQAVEDRIAINELMTNYALAVDGDQWEQVGALWLDDGTYELDAIGDFVGPEGVQDMLRQPAHTFVRANHGGHLLGHPTIILDGDRAVATNYGQILTREEERPKVYRFIIARWELKRTPDGWRVARRINKLVDDDNDARALAAAAHSWTWDPQTARETTNA